MTGEIGEQSGMETAKDKGRGGGQMNRDIVRRLVKRKQRRDGRLKEKKLCVYVYIWLRKTKQFIIKTESDRERGGEILFIPVI